MLAGYLVPQSFTLTRITTIGDTMIAVLTAFIWCYHFRVIIALQMCSTDADILIMRFACI